MRVVELIPVYVTNQGLPEVQQLLLPTWLLDPNNLSAEYQGTPGKCIKFFTSARHNLYEKKGSIKKKYLPEHMAGLCKENVVVSTLIPGSQTLTISQHLQENFFFFF